MIARHDEAARSLLDEHEGLEIDKSDGFLLLFERPIDAVGYALAYHRALASLSDELGVEIRARAGIHLGEVFLRTNPPAAVARGAKPIEVEGLAKPTAARIMSAAVGGQTLLTRAAYDLAHRAAVGADRLAGGEGEVVWSSHGHYLFKGIEEPVEVLEVGVAGVAPYSEPTGGDKVRRAEVAAAEGRHSSGADPGAAVAGWPRRATAAAVVAAVLVAGLYFLDRTRSPSGTDAESPGAGGAAVPLPDTSAVRARPSVAVLGFKNLTGRDETAWLSTALSEMLTTELGAGGALRAVPGERIAQMRIDLALAEAESYAEGTLERIRRHLANDYLVLGSYLALGAGAESQLRLDLRLEDSSGEMLETMSESGAEAELFALVSRTGRRLRAALGAADPSAEEAAAVAATLPRDPEAARLYAEGLERLRRLDAKRARELLEAAVAAEPEHALAHSALAEAWSQLGYESRARSAAEGAFQRSGGLPERERLQVEARFRQALGEWGRAVELWQRLWASAPDDLEAGLALAEAQWGEGAMRTVEALRALPGEAGEDPRIELAAARAAAELVDYELQLEAASRAAAAAQERGAQLVQALALGSRGWALYRLGRYPEASAAVEQALEIYRAAGHPVGQAEALEVASAVSLRQGERERARGQMEQVLALQRQAGNRAGEATALNNLAVVALEEGTLGESKGLYEESLEISREIGDRSGEALVLLNLARTVWPLGDLAGARERLEAGLEINRDLDDRSLQGVGQLFLGAVQLLQGEPSAARRNLEEGLELLQAAGLRRFAAEALSSLAEVAREEGDPDSARRRAVDASELFTELGEEGRAALSRLFLARLTLEEGRAAEAEAAAESARDSLRRERAPDGDLQATGLVARALAAQGKRGAAERQIEAVRSLAAASESALNRLRFGLDEAAVAVTGGRAEAEARQQVRTLLGSASEIGAVALELEAGLRLGQLELRSEDPAAGAARLEAVEREARSAGFERIAALAAAARP